MEDEADDEVGPSYEAVREANELVKIVGKIVYNTRRNAGIAVAKRRTNS